MIFENIKGLLGRKKPTSETLRSALAEIDIASHSKAVNDLTAERKKMLLEADDATIEKVEQRLARAVRDRDRALAAREELESRLAATEEAERREALQAARDRVEQQAADAAREIGKRYPAAAREIVSLVEAALAADRAVRDWNSKSGHHPEPEMGGTFNEPIATVDQRLFHDIHPDGFYGAFIQTVRLPQIAPDFAPGIMDVGASYTGHVLKPRAA